MIFFLYVPAIYPAFVQPAFVEYIDYKVDYMLVTYEFKHVRPVLVAQEFQCGRGKI